MALGKKIIVKNATAYTWDWYCHLVVDRASFTLSIFIGIRYNGNNNTSITLQPQNGPNKLDCYIKLSWRGLQVTNTPAYSENWYNKQAQIFIPENV